MKRIKPAPVRVKPKIFDPMVMGRDGASTRNFLSSPLATRRSYSTVCSRLNFSNGIDPVNIRISSGKFSGRQ